MKRQRPFSSASLLNRGTPPQTQRERIHHSPSDVLRDGVGGPSLEEDDGTAVAARDIFLIGAPDLEKGVIEGHVMRDGETTIGEGTRMKKLVVVKINKMQRVYFLSIR